MRYRLTQDDVELLEFLKKNQAISGVDERYQGVVRKLEKAASQGEVFMVLGNLQANILRGSCDVDTRIAEVVFAQVHDYVRAKQGIIYSAELDPYNTLSPH